MKSEKTNKEKKPHTATFSFRCGELPKMAEMMKSCCPGEGNIMNCCSSMGRMMAQGKGIEAEETRETQKPTQGGENG